MTISDASKTLVRQEEIKTILVVDDQEPVRSFVTTILERRGYLTLIAASGEDAIEIAQGHAGRIDMLVSDLQMLGMSGIEAGLKLTAARPGMRVLLMSGADPSDVRLPYGWEFLAKPFTPSELLNAITNI